MDISARTVRFDDNSMWVELSDGRTIGVPYAWFPRLLNATPGQRNEVESVDLGCIGTASTRTSQSLGCWRGGGTKLCRPPPHSRPSVLQ